MINWTIGQLGLGEAQVLGMGPQGTSKDKGASARLEADLSLDSPVSFCSFNFLLTLSGKNNKKKNLSSFFFLIASAGRGRQLQRLTLC